MLGPTTRSRWSYGASKAIDEFLALAYWRERRLPVVIGRFFNVVGPRQTGAYGMVLPRLVDAALAGGPLVVHDDGRQQRCFAHVSDVVRMVLALMAAPEAVGGVFNIGSDRPVSILELAQRVVAAVGSGDARGGEREREREQRGRQERGGDKETRSRGGRKSANRGQRPSLPLSPSPPLPTLFFPRDRLPKLCRGLWGRLRGLPLPCPRPVEAPQAHRSDRPLGPGRHHCGVGRERAGKRGGDRERGRGGEGRQGGREAQRNPG